VCASRNVPVWPWQASRVGQNHIFIRIDGEHTVFSAGKSVIYGVYIQFWPTLQTSHNLHTTSVCIQTYPPFPWLCYFLMQVNKRRLLAMTCMCIADSRLGAMLQPPEALREADLLQTLGGMRQVRTLCCTLPKVIRRLICNSRGWL
jgi:hypothetical protein